MKNCLIISTPRSGSTNLMLSISSAYNLPFLFEPIINPSVNIDYKNVTKIIVDKLQTYNNWMQFVNRYENIILLTRKDIKSAAESLNVIEETRYNINNEEWDESEIVKSKMDLYMDRMTTMTNDIIEISNILNLPVNYYEDVYSKKRLVDSSIKLDLSFFSSDLKLRKKHIKNII